MAPMAVPIAWEGEGIEFFVIAAFRSTAVRSLRRGQGRIGVASIGCKAGATSLVER